MVKSESDSSTKAEDKYARFKAIYIKWKHKDTMEGINFLLYQKCRIKDINLNIFGFSLNEVESD